MIGILPTSAHAGDEPDLLASALEYAKFGWYVLPLHTPIFSSMTGQPVCDCQKATSCHNIGKHPWTWRGRRDASIDERTILRWWRTHPRANIGIATGAISGLFVPDIDPRHNGEEHLQMLLAKYGATLPVTRVANTGGGGWHRYYTHPKDGTYSGCTALDGFSGVDVRADGNYVVAPPSLHASGQRYVWDIITNDIAPAPDWLLDLTRKREHAKIFSIGAYQPRPGAGDHWLAKAEAKAVVGNRNDTGFAMAQQLRDDRLSFSECSAIMLAYQQAVTTPDNPYTKDEAIGSLGSAFSRPPRDPARRVGTRLSTKNTVQVGRVTNSNIESGEMVFVGTYKEDRAIRWAILDRTTWHRYGGKLMCTATRDMTVYLDRVQPPIAVEEAQYLLRSISATTVLTIRIAMAIWNLAHYERRTAPNGSVVIPFTDILLWRGIKPHKDKRITSGESWDRHDLDRVRDDFRLGALIHIKGQHTIYVEGRSYRYQISGQYVRISEVSARHERRGDVRVIGVGFNPGDWINDYIRASNYQLAPIDRQIFRLNPQNQQNELRLALYLTERWRMLAHTGAYAAPISMEQLLRESVIEVDSTHLTTRFAPRIEKALQRLKELGIIGALECLTPADTSQAQWGATWLLSTWCILPPNEVLRTLNDIAATPLSAAA